MVVELEGHLHVQAHELGQVTVSVGVLSSEHTTDSVNFAETGKNIDKSLTPTDLIFSPQKSFIYRL